MGSSKIETGRGATAYHGIMGYGAHHHFHQVTDFHIGDVLPVIIEIVDTPENLKKIYPFLEEVFAGGVGTIIKTEMVTF